MKTATSKAKGRRLQNKIVELLRELYDIDQDKTLYEGHIQAAIMGSTGVDVKISEEYLKKIPLAIECKNQEKWQIEVWFKQAKQNTKPKQITTLVISKNRTKPLVVIEADIFFKLIHKTFNK